MIDISSIALYGDLDPIGAGLMRDHVADHGELRGRARRLLRVVIQVQLALCVRPREITHRIPHLLLLKAVN